jgi:hypothetical protein
MAMADVCAAFSIGQSTASAKARVISDALHAHRMDPAWILPSLVDQNPLVWMPKVNGVLVDLRDMPRELQVINCSGQCSTLAARVSLANFPWRVRGWLCRVHLRFACDGTQE